MKHTKNLTRDETCKNSAVESRLSKIGRGLLNFGAFYCSYEQFITYEQKRAYYNNLDEETRKGKELHEDLKRRGLID
jgi:hypothetical protein